MSKTVRDEKINIVKLAYLYFREGRWDNAIEEYRKLLEIDPEDMNVHKMLGDVYVRKNDHAQAYEEYSKVEAHFVQIDQTDKASLIQDKINRLDQNRLPAAARQKRSRLPNKSDKTVEDSGGKETVDSEDKVSSSNLEKMEVESGQFSNPVERYTRLGESFFESHLFKKAMEMFKKVVALDSQNRVGRVRLAQIYAKTGMENEAKKEYLNAAGQALTQDDLDHAFEYANKAVELKSIEAQYILGVVLFKRRQWAEAREKLDTLLRFKTSHAGGQVYLAKVFDEMNLLDKAVETFQKALKLDKDGVLALEAWAEYCAKRKLVDEAVKTFTELIGKAAAGGDRKRALELARKLLAVDVTRVSSKLKLAQLLQSVGDLKGAADIYYHLAQWYKNQNEKDEANKYIQKTLELYPEHPAALEMTPKELAQKVPGEEIVLTYRVFADEPAPTASPKTDPVVEPEVRLVDVSPAETFNDQMGIADQFTRQGLLAEAIGVYQQLLDADPGNWEVIRKINKVYEAYAKTGTDLTDLLTAAPPVDEETQKRKVVEAKKTLSEIKATAVKEAELKINAELEKKNREAFSRTKRDSARLVLKELASRAVELADRKLRGEVVDAPPRSVEMPLVVPANIQSEAVSSLDPLSLAPRPVETIFLTVGESSFSTTRSTAPRPNVRDKMKKIGFV
ncbi:MAG TPA: tetratricopeptide repeat protein [bacterium]|jgi:superkiller protein 3|nr:tetratricopeptide repeat protein [bacterium]